jgi:hypothetical protein
MATIIAISVIVTVILVYSLWGSLEHLKQLNKVFGSLIIIFGVAVWIISERLETLQARVEADESQKGEQRLSNIERRVARRTDLLIGNTRAELVRALTALPPESVLIRSLDSPPESFAFGNALARVFQDSGSLRMHQVNTEVPGRPGVEVRHMGQVPRPEVVLIVEALRAAGIPEVKTMQHPDLGDAIAQIYVGNLSDVATE